MQVLAIDPGYEQSAWVLFDGATVLGHAIQPNQDLLTALKHSSPQAIVLEVIESFGMAVGREVFETVFWCGRFYEVASNIPGVWVDRMHRKAVKLHLCQSVRALDTNIRTALCDRWGGKVAAIGKAKTPGPLYGLKSHEWSALAIAVTWMDHHAPTFRQYESKIDYAALWEKAH